MNRLAEILNRWFWVTAPRWAGRRSMAMAGILGDGRALSARPRLGGLLPASGVLLAFLMGAIHPFEVSRGSVVTESLPALFVLAGLGGLGAAVGFWGFAGFVVGDLFLSGYRRSGGTFVFTSGMGRITQQYVPLAVVYAVIFVLMVLVPVVVEWIVLDLHARSRRRRLIDASAFLGLAVLVYLWAQAAAFLIRPVWSFQGGVPALEAVVNLQLRWWVPVLGAVTGRAGRLLVSRSLTAPPLPAVSTTGWLASSPWWLRTGLKSLGFAIVLGGLVDNLLIGLGTWAGLFGIFTLVERMQADPSPWVRRMWGWPVVVRLAIPVVVTLGLGLGVRAIAEARYVTTLSPMLVSSLVGLFVFAILVPPPRSRS